MKRFLSLLFLFIFLCAGHLSANMAKPEIDGSSQSEAYSAADVDILHEELFITLIDTYTAHFKAVYTVKSDVSGFKMPLMFDAMMSDVKNFRVWMDSIEVTIDQSPSIYNENYFTIWKDSLRNNFDIDVTISANQFRYFIVSMTAGVHVIRVEYDAVATIDQWKVVNSYTFFYNLEPARSWKSFGRLDLTIDASRVKDGVDVTVDDEEVTGLIKHWTFNELPQRGIVVKSEPQLDEVAIFMIDNGNLLLLLVFLLLFIIHIWSMWKYRIRNPHRKFSLAMFWGAVILVLLMCICYVYHFSIVDYFIGEHASRRHGYIFLIFLFYPIFLFVYLAIVLMIDTVLKKKVNG